MIGLAIKVLALAMMVRLLIATDKPWLCAGIYGAVTFIVGAVFGDEIASIALMAGLAFAAAFVYFWILNRLDESSVAWWVVAIIGVPLVFL
jgi:hypothetical protein